MCVVCTSARVVHRVVFVYLSEFILNRRSMRSALTLLNTFQGVCVEHRAEHGAEARAVGSRLSALGL